MAQFETREEFLLAQREMIEEICETVEFSSKDVIDICVVIRHYDPETTEQVFETAYIGDSEEITKRLGHNNSWCLGMNVVSLLFGGSVAVLQTVHEKMDENVNRAVRMFGAGN